MSIQNDIGTQKDDWEIKEEFPGIEINSDFKWKVGLRGDKGYWPKIGALFDPCKHL